jgi:hypothetical protein
MILDLGADVAKRQFAGVAPRRAAQFVLERIDAQRVLDRDLQTLGADRLDDEIGRAGAHRGDDASIEPCAVCTIAGTAMMRAGACASSTPMPSRSGMTRSRMTRLIDGRSLASRRASAPSPDSAVSTS